MSTVPLRCARRSWSVAPRHRAAVDGQVVAGDVGAFVAAEEQRGAGDVPRVAGAAQGGLVTEVEAGGIEPGLLLLSAMAWVRWGDEIMPGAMVLKRMPNRP